MKEAAIFYYRFNRLNAWFIFNMAFLVTMVYGMTCWPCLIFWVQTQGHHTSMLRPGGWPCLIFWVQTQVLIGVLLFSWIAWGYKYLIKHPAVVIDDDGITIDGCRPLFWKDVKNAEEKTVKCCFKKYKVIVLNPKEGIEYKYNFLQKHNCGFSAFSIPLYGILSREDEAEITKRIALKTTLIRSDKTG